MIRKITGKNVSHNLHHLKNSSGELITNKEDIANSLGQSVERNSSSTNYSHEFQRIKASQEKKKLNFSTNKFIKYNKKFTLRDLKRSIRKSNNSSFGPDQIHYEILRHLPDRTLVFLLDIINEIWKDGTFPESWKSALILAIPKPGKDHYDPNNYRPIALTSCICKTVERMVNERLIWYLEKNKLINKNQCGFRANRSTMDHLVRMESFIRNAFINQEHLVAVFFDLQKAYDTTWKYGIMKDMHKLGLRGCLPIFIQNFLDDRSFQILFGCTLSDVFQQEEGVPQGAILSTTLFSIKINNITQALASGTECSLYVDDFVIIYRSKSVIEIERKLQMTINKLQDWTLQNGFTISQSKTVAMHFWQRKWQPDHELKIGSTPIKFVKEAKFLGLIWDSKLSFLPHIMYIKNKCKKALNLLRVLSHTEWGGDKETLLKLYRSLVRSKLDYGCIVYGSARKSYIERLDPIHNQGLRLCLGAFRTTPVKSLYVEANEPPLWYRREKLTMQYAIKLKANPGNPAYSVVFHPMYKYKFLAKPREIPPFGLRAAHLLSDAGIDTSNILLNQIPDRPVWDAPEPEINHCPHYI